MTFTEAAPVASRARGSRLALLDLSSWNAGRIGGEFGRGAPGACVGIREPDTQECRRLLASHGAASAARRRAPMQNNTNQTINKQTLSNKQLCIKHTHIHNICLNKSAALPRDGAPHRSRIMCGDPAPPQVGNKVDLVVLNNQPCLKHTHTHM